MKRYFVRCSILHLAISALYFFATSYEFVVTKQPNPIGVGIQQFLCIFFHVIGTIAYFMIIPWKSGNKKLYNRKLLLNIGAIVLAVAIMATIDAQLSNKLWSLHDRYNSYHFSRIQT